MTDENTLRTDSVVEAAIRQNSTMRQELADVGNAVSDLARAMGVDQAKEDGSWPNLLGRVEKLTRKALAAQPRDDVRELLREIRDQFEDYAKSHWDKAAEASGDEEKYAREQKAQRNEDWVRRIDTALAPTTQGTDSGLADEAFDIDKAAHNHAIQFLSSSDGDFPELHDLFVSAIAEGMVEQERLTRTDRKAVLAEEQRNLLVKCVRGDPVHHDDRMALLRALAEGAGK